MLELTQQSLAFQQERSQLTEMLHAQHESMQQLIEETQTQEAALQALSQHAQDADQQVRQGITSLQSIIFITHCGALMPYYHWTLCC